MPLEVIGAGFGRTGTHSLAHALEILGFGPCYHTLEVPRNPGHTAIWLDAIDGKEVDWDSLFKSYKSSVEWPALAFLRPLLRQYPEAKVVLTLRAAADWYESASATIFEGIELGRHNPDQERRERGRINRRLILEQLFSNKHQDKAHAMRVYEEHIENVKDWVPLERLLSFRVSEGWAPLCAFLGVSEPKEAFPKLNDRESMLSQMPDWARKIKDSKKPR